LSNGGAWDERSRTMPRRGREAVTTFGLVPGGSHNAWCWSRLVPELELLGHVALPVTLPVERIDADLGDYAAAVQDGLASAEGEIVIVGHSLAGRYLPLAAEPFPDSRIVFLCSFIPVPGVPGDPGPTANPDFLDAEGRLAMPHALARNLFYGGCDDETAAWALGQLHPQPRGIILGTFPVGGWRTGLEAAFICGEDDPIMPPERARAMSTERLGVEPIVVPGGHSPFLSDPRLLAETLDGLLRDDQHWGVPIEARQ
jgi:pimeloyl-ACP methyl ester carboxylesterase